jgi:hypothetical protein
VLEPPPKWASSTKYRRWTPNKDSFETDGLLSIIRSSFRPIRHRKLVQEKYQSMEEMPTLGIIQKFQTYKNDAESMTLFDGEKKGT